MSGCYSGAINNDIYFYEIMLLSLGPSFSFLTVRGKYWSIIVDEMPENNMAFGRFRYVAFHLIGWDDVFCLKKQVKKQCLSYNSCYSKIFVLLACISFLLKINPKSSAYFFFYLCADPVTTVMNSLIYLLPFLILARMGQGFRWGWNHRIINHLNLKWPKSIVKSNSLLLTRLPKYVWENIWSYKGS